MVVAPTVSTNGCIALGLLLQLTVLAQFVWMFVLVSIHTYIYTHIYIIALFFR